jgi:hypothetical protein
MFKLKHFYTGVVLDNDGNYTEGFHLPVYYETISSKQNKFILPIPP